MLINLEYSRLEGYWAVPQNKQKPGLSLLRGRYKGWSPTDLDHLNLASQANYLISLNLNILNASEEIKLALIS